jgi:CheY-like chemotaxis protein
MDKGKQILIIEDDIFLAEVLVNKLVASGFKAEVSNNGKEGLRRIKSMHPDLILLDIILPEMNGYQILEAKQADPDIKDIPVIIVSNSGQPVEVKRALTLGVKNYLIKADIDPDEAVEKVKEELAKLSPTGIDPNVGAPKPPGALVGKKLLWVEDDRFLKDIITVRLSNEGCQLFHAADETEAFNLLAKQVPDVILLDILLPGADGFEILRKLKAGEATAKIPVILLSNLSQKADLEKGKELGALKFLVKSTVTLDEIISQIKSVLTTGA